MTIRRSAVLFIVFLFALMTSSNAAQAKDGVGTKTVRNANTKLSGLLASNASASSQKKQLEKAQAMLGGFLDIEELGRRALKDHWPKISKQQQDEFTALLRQLIETNYLKGMQANVKYKVKYLGEEENGDFLLVRTIIESKRRGRPLKIEIDYLLAKSGKLWRTFDIKTDGIGLVENYRAMFNKIIGKSGFDALLAQMRKKLATLR